MHWPLSQYIWLLFSAPTWSSKTICSSRSRGLETLFRYQCLPVIESFLVKTQKSKHKKIILQMWKKILITVHCSFLPEKKKQYIFVKSNSFTLLSEKNLRTTVWFHRTITFTVLKTELVSRKWCLFTKNDIWIDLLDSNVKW